MNTLTRHNTTERGAAMMIAVIFFILASVLLVLGLSAPAAREYRIGLDALTSRQSYAAGESGVEDTYYRMKNAMHVASGASFSVGSATVTTTITNLGGGVDSIVGAGSILGDARSSTLRVIIGAGIPLPYAVMTDDGGLDMEGTSSISGDVYADSQIYGSDTVSIAGTAQVGNSQTGTFGIITGDDAAHQIHVSGTGDVYAHTVRYTNATGALYCNAVISSSTLCVSRPDPVYTELPISSVNVANWESDATSGGVISGSYGVATGGVTLGPKKITGNLTVPDSANLTLSGALWVTGDLVVSGTGSINLSSSYGAQSGVIIVDGTITTSSASHVVGSGAPESHVLLLSNDTSSSAITYGGTGAALVYARFGTATVEGAANVPFVAGQAVNLRDTASIVYEPSLSSTVISTGVGTPPTMLSWKETE